MNQTESKLTPCRIPASTENKICRMTTSNRTPMGAGARMMSQGELYIVLSVAGSEYLHNYHKWQHAYDCRPATAQEVEERNAGITAQFSDAARRDANEMGR
jgi:hypothetical protein